MTYCYKKDNYIFKGLILDDVKGVCGVSVYKDYEQITYTQVRSIHNEYDFRGICEELYRLSKLVLKRLEEKRK